MAIAQNWHRIYKRFAPQHAWQIFDGQRMTACRTSHFRRTRDVSGRDEGEAQSILRHRLNIPAEIVDWQVDRWLELFSAVPDIVPALSSSVVV